MRLSKLVLFAALLSPGLVATAFAQHGGGGHGGGGGGRAGGGGFSAARGGTAGGGFHAGSVGGFRAGTVSGFHAGVGHGYWYGGRWYGGTGLYLGFGGYPYYGYYGYPYYGYGYAAPYYYGAAPYGYDGGYATAPPPPQTYGYDQYPQQGYPQQSYPPQGQGQVAPPPGAPQQTQPQTAIQGASGQYYLIAFTDHTIQAANAYKVEGDQIYWQDRDNQEHHAPLSKVDVPFSQQINRDRNVDFQIP
jgi:hypothetical protein